VLHYLPLVLIVKVYFINYESLTIKNMKKCTVSIAAIISFIAVSFSQGVQFSEIQNWTGTGSQVAMLIIDFNDGQVPDAYAFGYRFDGSKTAEDMLNDIANANSALSISIGSGFLNDIIFGSQEGIGGNPDYWASFTFINQNWEMNWGISEILTDSIIFGFSYTDWYQDDTLWLPTHLPQNPVPAPATTHLRSYQPENIQVLPNPSTDYIKIQTSEEITKIDIFAISGSLIYSCEYNCQTIDVQNFSSGLYGIVVSTKTNTYWGKFIKE
jgi:hypothetical protein